MSKFARSAWFVGWATIALAVGVFLLATDPSEGSLHSGGWTLIVEEPTNRRLWRYVDEDHGVLCYYIGTLSCLPLPETTP